MLRSPILYLKQVNLERLPKKEKGFEFEFVEFTLGSEEEAIVQIGWAPVNGTPLREVILAKFGKHHAQIKIIASCKAPIEKVIINWSQIHLRSFERGGVREIYGIWRVLGYAKYYSLIM